MIYEIITSSQEWNIITDAINSQYLICYLIECYFRDMERQLKLEHHMPCAITIFSFDLPYTKPKSKEWLMVIHSGL